MAKFSFLTLFIIVCLTGYSQKPQKKTFDVISFTPPSGWQEKQNDGSVQLLIADEKTAAIKNLIQLDGDPAMQPPSNSNGIVGLWIYYTIEASGYSNGMPIPTAGYFRREYVFNADGSYLFRLKNWSVYMKEILFIYETGTWSVNGSQLIITPARGPWINRLSTIRPGPASVPKAVRRRQPPKVPPPLQEG